MTKEEALEQLEFERNWLSNAGYKSRNIDIVFSSISKMIQELKQEPMWISVSERLPKEEGLYLVSVKNDHERRYSKTCWYEGSNHWFARQDVEAWMPLPQPYKAESEEAE